MSKTFGIRITREKRVDWFRVVTDLERKGYSGRKLHEATDIPRSTIAGWKLGNGRPKFEEGVVLLRFWSEITGKTLDDAPTERSFKL